MLGMYEITLSVGEYERAAGYWRRPQCPFCGGRILTDWDAEMYCEDCGTEWS